MAVYVFLIFNCELCLSQEKSINPHSINITFKNNLDAGTHSLWYNLTYKDYYESDDSLKPRLLDSIQMIIDVDKEFLIVKLIREDHSIDSVKKKIKIKKNRIKVKTKRLIGGLPPVLWTLGWRSASIYYYEENLVVKANSGAIAFFTILPFTGRTPDIKDVELQLK